jgi:hypothetical protein
MAGLLACVVRWLSDEPSPGGGSGGIAGRRWACRAESTVRFARASTVFPAFEAVWPMTMMVQAALFFLSFLPFFFPSFLY